MNLIGNVSSYELYDPTEDDLIVSMISSGSITKMYLTVVDHATGEHILIHELDESLRIGSLVECIDELIAASLGSLDTNDQFRIDLHGSTLG